MITDEGEHDEGAAMRLKNQGSRRWVPLAEPVRDFVEWAQARQDGPLFPAKADMHGIVSAAFSKRYGRLLRNTILRRIRTDLPKACSIVVIWLAMAV